MIIKKLIIDGFGKFSNEEIELNKGLNIIYGENEAGKTTLHTFIKGMLFGMGKSTIKGVVDDIYNKYEPWDNPSNYAGRMIIEEDGIEYRLERNFNKDSESFKIINTAEGIELSELEMADLFYDLNEANYYNTISVGQLGGETTEELADILNNYAANLVNTKSEEIDLKGAIEELGEQKKEVRRSISGLERSAVVAEEFELDKRSSKVKKEQAKFMDSYDNRTRRQTELEEELTKLKEIEEDEKDEVSRKKAAVKFYEERLEILDKENKVVGDTVEKKRKKITDLSEELEECGVRNEVEAKELNKKAVEMKVIPEPIIGLAILELVIAIVIFIVVKSWIPKALLVCFLIATVAFAIVKYILNKKQKEMLLLKSEQMFEMLESRDKLTEEMEKFQQRIAENKVNINKIKNDLEDLQNAKVDDKLIEKIAEVGVELKEVVKKIENIQWDIDHCQQQKEEVDKAKEVVKEKFVKIDLAEEDMRAIDEAIRHIEQIAVDIRENFGKDLNRKASAYLAAITKGKYIAITIDDKMNINVEGANRLVKHSKLSKGTMEQVYMSLRLASADMLFETKKPIILDDAFAHYDNRRMANTIAALSNNYEQIIIFTCHTREKVVSDKVNIAYTLRVL